MRNILAVLPLAALTALSSCDKPTPSTAPTRGPVLILAAASVADTTAQIAESFDPDHPRLRISSGGSNALARQILAGAPADLFLSANEQWADAIEEADLVTARTNLLSNRLVLVVPDGNPADVHTPADLLKPQVSHVALAGENVPAGIYAAQALTAANLLSPLTEANKIARGQDVRLTLAFVETGEAQVGVVYATDARASARVQVVYTFPPDSHDPIVYPLLLLKHNSSGDATPEARSLYDYLASPEAMRVFEAAGFTPAEPG